MQICTTRITFGNSIKICFIILNMELDSIMNTKPINTESINMLKKNTDTRIRRTHLFELLSRDFNKEMDVDSDQNIFDFGKSDANVKPQKQKHRINMSDESWGTIEKSTDAPLKRVNDVSHAGTSYSSMVKHDPTNESSDFFMDTDIVCKRLRDIMMFKEYNNPASLLNRLNFTQMEDFIIVTTNEINESLRHTDAQFDRVLHQTKGAVFDKTNFLPIFYLEKSIKDPELSYMKNDNSYLKSYVYDVIPRFYDKEFDKSIISIQKNHIGSYIVLFYHKTKWYFMFLGSVYEFNADTHSILYEHIGSHLKKFDKALCYHMVLVDTRLQKLITPICDANHVVLIKTTEKYTLTERSIVFDRSEKRYGVFVQDTRIYISCMDEMHLRLEELDIKNTRAKKLLNRGFLMKIRVDNADEIYVAYDTITYKKLMMMIPNGLGLHGVHLKLYQTDKLNYFLQYINDSYTDIVKRINISMSTMSREILDIYHMTRKKKNSNLYNILPQSYRQILYQLHSDYIDQKNGTTTIPNQNVDLLENKDLDTEESDDSENKVSISVDNVYTKLKDLDTSLLIDIYKDREELLKSIEQSEDEAFKNPIKDCINTRLQTTFLRSNRPV